MAKSKRSGAPADVRSEYAGAAFGDVRLSNRLISLAATVSAKPDSSFPKATENDADLEATYRFLRNVRVRPEAILAPHVHQTVSRAEACAVVVVAHDTTEFSFGADSREDLGPVAQGESYGFFGHFALAIDASTGKVTARRGGARTAAARASEEDEDQQDEEGRPVERVPPMGASGRGSAAATRVDSTDPCDGP
jgi:hypothetical protein